MKRSLVCLSCFGLIVGLLLCATAGAQDEPSYELSFDCPASLKATGDFQVEVTALIASADVPEGEPDAQGWSIGMSADCWAIVDITVAGTVSEKALTGGFTVAELTADARGTNPDAGCGDLAGDPAARPRDGAVSAIVLDLVAGTTLDVVDCDLTTDGVQTCESPWAIAKLTLAGVGPGPGEDPVTCCVRFEDGCEGSGEIVENKVTWKGNTVQPTLGECCTEIAPTTECPQGLGGDTPTGIQVIMATASVDEAGFGLTGETSELFAGLAPTADAELPAEIIATPGDATVVVSLVSNALANGVQGWSLSMPVDESGGAALADVTIVGTAAEKALSGGFSVTELTVNATGNPDAGCPSATGHGVVSAIVLDLVAGTTLQTTGTASALAIVVSGADGDSLQLDVADGCEGSGEPVNNVATVQGGSEKFLCGQSGIVRFVLPPSCPLGLEGAVPTGIQVIMATASVDEAGFGLPGETSELFAGLAPTPDAELPARIVAPPGETTVLASIVSNALETGVQGWSLSLPVDESGGAALADVTIVGTAAEKALSGGFSVTELTVNATGNPDAGCPSPTGHGVVSAIVLDLVAGTTLQTTGTASALAIVVSGAEGDSLQINVEDGCEGSGEPVNNVATVQGGSERFLCGQSGIVSFVKPPIGDMIRCDPNEDGKSDIADAIWIVNMLFRGGPSSPDGTVCVEAADCNGQSTEDPVTGEVVKVDLSDAIYAIDYQFLGGDPPPAPFPDCGRSEDSTEESCPAGSNGDC